MVLVAFLLIIDLTFSTYMYKCFVAFHGNNYGNYQYNTAHFIVGNKKHEQEGG